MKHRITGKCKCGQKLDIDLDLMTSYICPNCGLIIISIYNQKTHNYELKYVGQDINTTTT